MTLINEKPLNNYCDIQIDNLAQEIQSHKFTAFFVDDDKTINIISNC